ncbi:hypothetical protein Sj15T_19000 [Sphingobium sp. TA15]|uniref:Uncharacterized protein n=1 Tax=Sphingobium indicum (strain DSM 16413 / CCM 7287 / MTCC 6362 / UT26 / NBRC 101211 / UT26S) TaxID=452662 RepID=D4Z4D3_SPHIU|nr:hypothetical protein [Sphingobium indicum]BAI97465.1 hypothetical protein SJA_C1-26310 [Sphingobium indicum UT26S]BDD66879.1 hypothetical protein Sj15T_19000 [Sphingobium sp. TA15]
MKWKAEIVEKACSSSVQAPENLQTSRVEVQLDQPVADIAKILNKCLRFLDELGLSQAGAHLGAAIDALPGQAAVPPIELLDLIADLPAVPSEP